MAKGKERQALAIRDAVQRASKVNVPCILDGANRALQAEAARIFADSAAKSKGGVRAHIIVDGGVLTVFAEDSHTTARVSGGSVAVATHG